MKALASLALAATLLATPAVSADFSIVHDTGGDSIVITGYISEGDHKVFNALLKKNPKVDMVGLHDSPGGDFAAAVSIGRTIHAKGLYTLATNDYCNSACAAIWLAGKQVYVLPGDPSPKFHLPNTYGTWEVGAANEALFRDYTRSIGVSDSFVSYVKTEAGPSNSSIPVPIKTLRSFGVDAYVLH